jgi:hypothetical protein
MPFNRGKAKSHRRVLRAFAESEAMSDTDGDEGLDIIESSRKGLDISPLTDRQLML